MRGALPGATALEQAKAAEKFTPVHGAWWAAVCKAHGDRDGTRALIEMLLLGRRIPHEDLVTGLAATLRVGALTADAVALEARKAQEADDADTTLVEPKPPLRREPTVTFLTARRLAHQRAFKCRKHGCKLLAFYRRSGQLHSRPDSDRYRACFQPALPPW